MTRALRFRPALLRSAALFAASAAAGPAFGQAMPPGMMAGPPGASGPIHAPASGMGGDVLGAFATPTGAPIAMAYGDPAALMPGTVMPGGPESMQTFMAPQIMGGPAMMGGSMPGSPGCNCGPGGAPMMGMPMMGPTYGDGMMGPSCGAPSCAAPMAGFDSCGDMCGTPISAGCDPCQGGMPICDPCQGTPPVYGAPGEGGLYHSMGGKPRCGWATGFSWVFLKPYYGTNQAFSISNGTGLTETTDFNHDFDLSPRVFVEYVGRSDIGLRATWFGYENDSDTETGVVPAGGFGRNAFDQIAFANNSISAMDSFDLDTIDLDVTQRIAVRKSLINIGGGLRWMGYEHDHKSTITGPFAPTQTGQASRQFDGVGPTVFAEWRRPIGSTRFSLLASVRGSLLYGQSETDSVLTLDGVPMLTSHAENDDFVATGETQLGGEWSAWIGERTVLFVQVAYEAQALLGVGTALDANDDLGLHGFNTTVGFEW